MYCDNKEIMKLRKSQGCRALFGVSVVAFGMVQHSLLGRLTSEHFGIDLQLQEKQRAAFSTFRTSLIPDGSRNATPSSCDHLFGLENRRIEEIRWKVDGRTLARPCIIHDSLGLTACVFGPIQIDLTKISGSALGNESASDVQGRAEHEEHLEYHKGALILREGFISSDNRNHSLFEASGSASVSSLSAAFTKRAGPAQFLDTAHWGSSAKDWQSPDKPKGCDENGGPTYFVTRQDYALLPMVVSTLYDVWATHRVLLEKTKITHVDWLCPPRIVWLDGHAYGGSTDDVYYHLFGDGAHLRHVGRLKGLDNNSTVTFGNAVVVNKISPFWEGVGIYKYKDRCHPNSGLHQFRDFVLDRYGIKRKNVESGANKTLTFLVRRDYHPHPRSDGRTDRQVEDVDADAKHLQKSFPEYNITVVSFEKLSFPDQIRIIAETDLLVAVHGAGNIHCIFLPESSKFIEYFPKGFEGRTRFKFLSHCLGIEYEHRSAVIKKKHNGGKITVSIQG